MCSFDLQVSGGWEEEQTSRASLVPSTRVCRVKGDLETRGRTEDHPASAALRNLLRTNPRGLESLLWKSEQQ